MRTVSSSGRISGDVPGPRGVYLVPGGVSGPGGCTWSRGYLVLGAGVYLVLGVYLVRGGCTRSGGVPAPGGVSPLGGGGVPGLEGLLQGGVPGPGGCLLQQGGVPGPGGVYLVPGGVPGQVLPLCGQTDACKNITFATSFRAVIIPDYTWFGFYPCAVVSYCPIRFSSFMVYLNLRKYSPTFQLTAYFSGGTYELSFRKSIRSIALLTHHSSHVEVYSSWEHVFLLMFLSGIRRDITCASLSEVRPKSSSCSWTAAGITRHIIYGNGALRRKGSACTEEENATGSAPI